MIGLRAAIPAELPALSALCLAAKAVWGYDTAFMDACREELTLREADLTQADLIVADDGSGPLGLAMVRMEDDLADLTKLYVAPQAMGRGIGRSLFDWSAETARARGATRMTIEADPNAAPFYRHMGAHDIGTAPSGSIPGRRLPLLELPLRIAIPA